MREDWKLKKLGDICFIRRGSSPRPIKNYLIQEGGMPWVKISDATEANGKFINSTAEQIKMEGVSKSVIVNPGDLILSNSGTAGLPMFMGITACIHDGWQTFRDLNGIDKEYLYYFLLFIRNILLHNAYDSVMKNLTLDMLRDYEIYLPPMDEQKRIVDVLHTIDNKIENNNKINRNLSEQVATIYKSWFIDFDRNAGKCPDDWKEATLGDVAEIGSGKRPPMKQAEKTDEVTIPLVGAASIMGYTNDVLYDSKILVTGRVGTHGVVQRLNEKCWPSDNTLVITTTRYEFVNQILLNVDYKSMNRGSTQPLITQGDLKKTEIILPKDDFLDEFEELAGGLMAQFEKNNQENIKLAEIRDSLLPKLMSGELDVSDLDV